MKKRTIINLIKILLLAYTSCSSSSPCRCTEVDSSVEIGTGSRANSPRASAVPIFA